MFSAARPAKESPKVLVLLLEAHLTRVSLDVALERVDASLALSVRASTFDLVVDARQMTGYDASARARFVAWNSSNKARLEHVAVLTDNVLWHMVVAAMSIASGQPMRAFAASSQATAWFAAT